MFWNSKVVSTIHCVRPYVFRSIGPLLTLSSLRFYLETNFVIYKLNCKFLLDISQQNFFLTVFAWYAVISLNFKNCMLHLATDGKLYKAKKFLAFFCIMSIFNIVPHSFYLSACLFVFFFSFLLMFDEQYVLVFNPNSIGVKYSFIVLGGDNFHHVSVLTSLLIKIYLFKFWIETLGICHD